MATHKKTTKKEQHTKSTKKPVISKENKSTKPEKPGHFFVRRNVNHNLPVDIEKELNRVVSKAEAKVEKEDEEIVKDITHQAMSKHHKEDLIIENSNDIDLEVPQKETTIKKSQQEDLIGSALEDIYKNTDGSLPDMKHFTKKKGSRFFRALFTLVFACAFLVAVFWVGLFFVQPGDSFSEKDIILTVSAEEQIRIGDDVHFRIRYVNAQRTALAQASLQVRFPEGFVFKESSIPADSERNDTWTLGALGEDESGYIDVYGTLYGNNEQEQSMRVFFTYKPENFSSEFQKVATVIVSTNKSPVRLEVNAPSETIAGSQQPLSIIVDREEGAGFSGPVAIEILPEGQFVKKNQNIDNDKFNEFRWTLPEDSNTIDLKLEGSFIPGLNKDSVHIPVRVVGWQDESRNGEAYVLSEQFIDIALINEDVVVSAVINGANTELSVQPGDTLNMSVSLRNSGDVAIEDINIQAILDAPSYQNRSILHWNDLNDPASGDIRGEQINDSMRRGVISWNKKQVVPLTRLGPDDEIVIDFSIPVRDADITALANFEAFQANISVDVQYNVNGTLQTASIKPIKVIINSDVELEVRDQISRSGETEDHSITWLLSNSFHELQNITLTAVVYGNTSFDNDRLVVPAGSTSYDAENKRLTWNIDTMPVSIDILPLQFTLIRNDINPSQTQLMSKVEFRATDTKTGEEIIIVGDEISLVQ